jgi:ketosteroid isomerase-like protein
MSDEPEASTAHATREVVTAYLAARERQDLETITALLDPEIEWHLPSSLYDLYLDVQQWHASASSSNPLVKGIDAVAPAQAGALLRQRLSGRTVTREVLHLVVDRDSAAVALRMTAVTLNGDTFSNEYCFIYVVEQGKITHIYEFEDTLNGALQYNTVIPYSHSFVPVDASDVPPRVGGHR